MVNNNHDFKKNLTEHTSTNQTKKFNPIRFFRLNTRIKADMKHHYH